MTPSEFLVIIFSAVLGYAIGSINLSIIISKLMGKGDIRDYGSKNAGTTNTLRVLGKGPALIVFIWDILKGVLAVLLARVLVNWIGIDANGIQVANYSYLYCFSVMLSSLAVILGHNYPCFFGFKGGKGVATSLGVLLAIEWRIGLICLAVGITGIVLMQMVSIGSIIAAIEYPILVCIIGGQFDRQFNANRLVRISYIAFSFLLGLMVILRHKANIERIRNGTENKLKFKKTPEEKIAEEKEKIQVSVEKSAPTANVEPEPEVKEEPSPESKTEEAIIKEKIDIKMEPKKKETKKKKQ